MAGSQPGDAAFVAAALESKVLLPLQFELPTLLSAFPHSYTIKFSTRGEAGRVARGMKTSFLMQFAFDLLPCLHRHRSRRYEPKLRPMGCDTTRIRSSI